MRYCMKCKEEIPQGTIGPFCSTEHRWLYARKQEEELTRGGNYVARPDPTIAFAARHGLWGRSPRVRT